MRTEVAWAVPEKLIPAAFRVPEEIRERLKITVFPCRLRRSYVPRNRAHRGDDVCHLSIGTPTAANAARQTTSSEGPFGPTSWRHRSLSGGDPGGICGSNARSVLPSRTQVRAPEQHPLALVGGSSIAGRRSAARRALELWDPRIPRRHALQGCPQPVTLGGKEARQHGAEVGDVLLAEASALVEERNIRREDCAADPARSPCVASADFSAEMTGDGTLVVSGTVDRVTAMLAGDGTVDLHDLVATDGTAHLQGTGTIRVHATSTLEATLAGTGAILYRGDPTVTMRKTGTGTIVPE